MHFVKYPYTFLILPFCIMPKIKNSSSPPSIYKLFVPYKWLIVLLVLLTLWWNALNLAIPQIISHAVDNYTKNQFVFSTTIWIFLAVSILIFILIYLQNIVQVYLAEKVAKNLRSELIQKIAIQNYDSVQKLTPAKLLTYLTSDVDAIKNFVSQVISSLVSSIFLIIGASILLLMINWKLALSVMIVLPLIGGMFAVVLSRVRKLFRKNQETIDWLNKIINESIFGSSLIRILNSQSYEYTKFLAASTRSRDIGLQILSMFAMMMPSIAFLSNMAILIILVVGWHFVILGSMSLGDFTAFNNYLAILIFPIILIGFMSNVIAQAQASYTRILEILSLPAKKDSGTIKKTLTGSLEVENLSLRFWEKTTLKNISFSITPKTKTAIIGPTAAWKTQLLYLLTWLTVPNIGTIKYDDVNLSELEKQSFHEQVGLVFQDSNLFHLTLRENIAFSNTVDDAKLQKAIDTAELHDFIGSLPEGLDTVVSERGASLSGGQKQRIMLARVLALDPEILFLDDFTARLDTNTESKILENITKNYPEITLISVTQKIEPIKEYDQIILLMEGEILAIGTHEQLLQTSPEYNQIYNSQFSLNNYELPTE